MTKVIVSFYDEKEERKRKKRLKGEEVSHAVEDGFFKITVDGSLFMIKEEHLLSLDIDEEEG